MAKNTEKDKDLDDFDLDIPELEELDLGEFEDLDTESREASKAGVAKELAKEAGKGFLDSVIKETAKKTLPEEYSYNYYEVLDYVDFAKELFGKNKERLNKSFYTLGKEIKKLLPFKVKLLDRYLEKYESDFEKFKTQTEEQIREASIQSTISSIFDKQLEIQKAIESRRESEEEAKDKRDLGISKANLDVLTSIDSNIAKQTAFTVEISKEYYKKSLEIQFKSYFVQVDMLKTMRDYYKGFSVQLDNVVKNTGLPEIVKYRNAEKMGDILKTQVTESIYKQIFGSSDYINSIKKRISSYIRDKVDTITNIVDQLASTLDMMSSTSMSGSGLSTLGSLLANLGGSTIGEKLAEKISPKLKERIKDNKYINAGANYLALLSSSPSTFFSELAKKVEKKAEENQDESTPIRFLASKLYGGLNEILELTKPIKLDREIKADSILNHNKPAIFDNNVHRSITEVIPLYLSKILTETTNLRIMYSSVHKESLKDFTKAEDLVYDYKYRRLTTRDKFKTSIERDLFKYKDFTRKAKSLASTVTNLATNELYKDRQANKAQIKLLNDKSMQGKFATLLQELAKREDIPFELDTIISYLDKEQIDKIQNEDDKAKALRIHKTINEVIGNNYKLKNFIRAIGKAKLKSDDLQSYFKDVKKLYPTTIIIELFKGVSKLGGSSNEPLNVLTEEEALFISRAFSRYIVNEGKDITTDNILSAAAFKFLDEKEYEILKDKIKIFIYQVNRIIDINNIQQVSSLQFLLGSTNKALKDNFDIAPEVFKTLYKYSPSLVGKGYLNAENLIGNLKKFEEDSALDIKSIRELSKVKKSEAKELITNIGSSNIERTLDNVVNKTNEYAGEFKEAIRSSNGNVFQMTRNIFGVLNKMGKDITTSFNKARDSVTEFANKINGIINTGTDKAIKASLNGLILNINNLIDKLNEIKKQEQRYLEEKIDGLNAVKQSFEENINNQKAIKEIEKSIEKTKTIHDRKMKVLDNLITRLNALKDEIQNTLNNNEKLDLKEIATNIKNKLTKLINDVNNELNRYEEAIS